MTAKLSPAARVRRRFLQGRTAKRDVLLSPLSAVSAAVESLTEVLGYIAEKEPALAATPENVGVVLVGFSKFKLLTRRVYPEHKRARRLLDELAALSDRITSLEHDVIETHNQATALRQQLEVSGETVRAALSPDSRIVHLTPLGAAPSASAVLAESRGKGQAVLLVTGLPPAPSGETYELWWIGPHGEAIKAATLHLDPQGAATATLTTPSADAHVVAGEVTLQPSKDNNTPSGTIYFRGATPP